MKSYKGIIFLLLLILVPLTILAYIDIIMLLVLLAISAGLFIISFLFSYFEFLWKQKIEVRLSAKTIIKIDKFLAKTLIIAFYSFFAWVAYSFLRATIDLFFR